MDINKTVPLPLYYQLTEKLRDNIKEKWAPGDKFFSERHIASEFSVSRITAGRVLNDLVKEGLLYRIQGKGTFVSDPKAMNAIEDSVKKRTNNIGFIVAKRVSKMFSGYHNPEELAILRHCLEQYGYNLFFSCSENKISGNKKLNELTKKLDGMIIEGEVSDEIAEFFASKIPVVRLDHFQPGITSVIADNIKGAERSASYLIKSGRKKIGIIYGTQSCVSFKERYEAVKRIITKNKLKFYPEFMAESEGLLSKGYEAANKILCGSHKPDAIVCANDIIAIGAIKAIHDNCLRVPEDIAVIGFDNIEMTEYVSPQLSTVKYDRSKLVKLATDIINAKIRGSYDGPDKVTLPVRLTLRQSC